MKKISIFTLLVLLFSICQNVLGDEPGFPALVKRSPAKQEIIGWKWRTALDNQIYPYLQMQVNQLLFLNSTGGTILQVHYLPNSNVVTSTNQNFVGFMDIDEQYPVPEDLKQIRGIRYHIMNFVGQEMYTIQREVPYDAPIPALYMANDGRSVLVDGYRGIVQIFRPNGKLNQQIDLFDDDVPAYEKPIACAIADSGEMIAILAQKRPTSFDFCSSTYVSGQPCLFCFSFDGKEILRNPLELNSAADVAISPSGNYLVASQYSSEHEMKSTMMDLDGNIVLEIPAIFRYAQFSSDDSLLFLADKKTFFKIELQKGTSSILNVIDPGEERMVAELIFAEKEGKVLILTAKSVFQNSRFEFIEPGLLGFAQTGEQLWMLNFSNERFITSSIFTHNSHLGIGFQSNNRIYREHSE